MTEVGTGNIAHDVALVHHSLFAENYMLRVVKHQAH
jgi:hypothetical protein